VDDRVLADLERYVGADEGEAVGLQPAAEAQLQPRQPCQQPDVVERQHPVRAHPAQQYERAAVTRRGLAAHMRRKARDARGCEDRVH
jgi:hypothetical protein